MARKKPPQPRPKRSPIKCYVDGESERAYLKALMDIGVIQKIDIDPRLTGNQTDKICDAIRNDLLNDAISAVFWVVDGGDQHIKQAGSAFRKLYKDWLEKKLPGNWQKLKLLVNQPCLEFWFLLHEVDRCPFFPTQDHLTRSSVFRKSFPDFEKNEKINLAKRMANDAEKRKTATQKAQQLDQHIQDERPLDCSCAQIHQLISALKIDDR